MTHASETYGTPPGGDPGFMFNLWLMATGVLTFFILVWAGRPQ